MSNTAGSGRTLGRPAASAAARRSSHGVASSCSNVSRAWSRSGRASSARPCAASPVALVLLAVVLAGVALARRLPPREAALPTIALVGAVAIELVVLRLFPGTGRYPFSAPEAAGALGFCVIGFAATWRVESARVLRYLFAAYAVAILTVYFVPSGLGENVARLRYVAAPLALLIVASAAGGRAHSCSRSWRSHLPGT